MERTKVLRITSLILAVCCLISFFAAALGVYECLKIRSYAKQEEAHAQDVADKMTELITLLKDNEQRYVAALGTFVIGGIIYESDYALEVSEEELSAYEDAMALVNEYTLDCFNVTELQGGDGLVESPAQQLGEDYDWTRHDDNGEPETLRSGEPWLDFDRVGSVCKAYLHSYREWNSAAQKETGDRLASCAVLFAAAVLGTVAALLALRGKGAAAVLSIFLLLVAGQGHAFGIMSGYAGFEFFSPGTPRTGAVQLVALVLFTLSAIAFAVAVGKARAAAKKAAELAGEPVYRTENAMIKSETRRKALGSYDNAISKYKNSRKNAPADEEARETPN